MAGENENGQGIASGDFKPPQSLIDDFKNVAITGDDDFNAPPPPPPPAKTQADLDAEAARAKAAENNGGGTDADKQKKADAEAAEKLAEDQKIAAMSPTEKDLYLKSKEKPADNNAPPPPPPVVEFTEESFNQEFEKRFGKKVEDAKALLEAEKEEVFANDQIKFFNDLAKSGVEINADYIAAITKNYEGMQNPLDILAEQMRQENPGMEEDEIEFEIRSRYRMDEWSAEGEEPTEIEKIMAKKQLREANETRDKLIDKRNSLSFIKPKDPNAEKLIAKERLESQQKFEAKLDTEIVPKIPKLSTEFTDKDGIKHTVDFDIDESAKGKVVPLMKAMGSNAGVYFQKYAGADGKFDHAKFLKDQLILENHEKIVRKSYEQGLALGSEKVVKDVKNIDFENNGKPPGQQQRKSFEASAAESLAKHL